MYTPSDKYLKASKKLDRKPRSKIIVDGIEYTGMDRIKDHPKISHNAERMIGEFPTKECKFSIFNRDNTLDLVGKDIQVFRGLLLEDNTIEYIPQGIFHVNPEDIKTNSTAKTIELTIKDKSIDFDTPYGGIDKITYPCTLGNFINEIITRRGFVLETPDFPFHNLILNERPNFDLNTATERYLIASAGELGGCTVQMSRIGGVRISKPYLTGVTIKKIDYKKLPSKEKTFGPINQVTLSRSNADNNDIVSKDDDSISQNGLYELRIIDNPYVDLVREQIVDQVASNLFGMTIVPFELEDVIDSYLYDINDSVAIVDKMNNVFDTTIMSISSSSRIFTKLKASVQNKTEANIKLAGSSKEILNQVKLDVDHNKQRIEALASEVTEDSEKVAKLEIDVDSIKESVQKTLSIIKTVQNKNKLTLDGCANDYLNYLKIKGDISLLFGISGTSYRYDMFLDDNLTISNSLVLTNGGPYELRNGPLYGSDNLFGRNPNLVIKNGNDIQKIKLPIDYLNYLDEETYDEFIVEKKEMFVIRRVGINKNGEKYKLSFETKQYLGTLKVILKEGTNEIYLESFNNATLECTYMIKNDYTNTFATKVELQSGITTTAESVLIEAQKKIDDLDVVNKLNISPEVIEILGNRLVINTSNFKLDEEGTAKMKNGEFQGKITGSSIQLNNPNDIYKGNFEILDSDGSNYWARSDRNYLFAPAEDAYISNRVCDKENNDYIAETRWSGNDWTGETSGRLETVVKNSDISTPKLYADNINNNSLEELKKNFEPLKNALEILKNTDFYCYNLKRENDNCKKHLGCVIGKNYNTSKEILDKDNTSVDLYSFITVCAQSIKEIYKEIEVLKNGK